MVEPVQVAFLCVFSILEVICLTLNILVCAVIWRTKSLRIATNKLLFNLAIGDLLIGLSIIPRDMLSVAFTHPTGVVGDVFCKFLTGNSFLWISSTASGFLLIVIAVERYFSVKHPNRRPHNTAARINGTVACCWLASLAANLPNLIILAYDEERKLCFEKWPSWAVPKAYATCTFFLGTSSVIVMYVFYSQVIYTLWCKKRRVTEISQAARLRARKNITKILALVTFIHTLCRTPNYMTYLLTYLSPSVEYGSSIYKLTVVLILLNSTAHPFLLCWNVQGFGRPMLAMFNCCPDNRVYSEPPPSQVYAQSRLSPKPTTDMGGTDSRKRGQSRYSTT